MLKDQVQQEICMFAPGAPVCNFWNEISKVRQYFHVIINHTLYSKYIAESRDMYFYFYPTYLCILEFNI